jgi:hypothetical protein
MKVTPESHTTLRSSRPPFRTLTSTIATLCDVAKRRRITTLTVYRAVFDVIFVEVPAETGGDADADFP